MRLRSLCSAIALLVATIVSCQCQKDAVQKRPNTFGLLFMTSMEGWIEPCGCTSYPLGGIARLATVVSDAKQRYELGTVFVDGGDLLFESAKAKNPADLCQETARVDVLLETLHELANIGTFAGPFDDAMGQQFRETKLKQHGIQDLKEKAKEGILVGPASFKLGLLFLDDKNAEEINLKAADLKKKGALATVAVTHLSRLAAKERASALTAIDAVILALAKDESPSSAEKPDSLGPIYVSAAKQGQYLGIIEFHRRDKSNTKWLLDARQQKQEARVALLSQRKTALEQQISSIKDEAQLAFLRGRLDDIQEELRDIEIDESEGTDSFNVMKSSAVALSRKVNPDTVFEARLRDYEKEIPRLTEQCEANTECPTLVSDDPHFVGAETCKKCHSAAFEFWSNAVHKVAATDDKGKTVLAMSGHAKAWKTLEEAGKTKDRSCVECHSTGFMQPGGFCKVKEVGKLGAVQCEACHGAGSMHAQTANKRFIKRDVPESKCRECHHVPHIATTESFVYKDKLERILGKGHGELFLAKIKHNVQR